MRNSIRWPLVLLAACGAICLLAARAQAGDFMDTWVTFVFDDDNLLAGPEDRSPHPGFQAADDQLFFENLYQKRTGRENQTHLVLYKRMPSYWPHLDVEASLVILIENLVNDETYDTTTAIRDDGSFLKMNYYFAPDYKGDNINLTAFPINADRFRLGYAYSITWGGNEIFPNGTHQVPGVRLKYEHKPGTDDEAYAFVGAKTARLLNEDIHERETYYGALAGFGISPMNWIRWEADGGFFQRGAFPPQGVDSQIGGKTVDAQGASTRLTFHQGYPIGVPIDFRLYKNDPDVARAMAQHENYEAGSAWSAAAEYTYISEGMLSWEDAEKTVQQPAAAGNVNFKTRLGNMRLFGDVIYRDLSFILFNIPGLAPYRAFPDNADITNEWFAAGGLDYYFDYPKLTPGFMLGYKHPATFTSDNVVTVFRDEDDWETLPGGEKAFDILAAKLSLKWEVAEFFTVLGETRYTLDNNQTKFETSDNESGRKRVFEDSNVTNKIGFSLLMQARF